MFCSTGSNADVAHDGKDDRKAQGCQYRGNPCPHFFIGSGCYGCPCDQSGSCRHIKSPLLHKAVQLQQSILIIPVAIDSQRNCSFSATFQFRQLFCCNRRNSASENRHGHNNHFALRLLCCFAVQSQIYRFYFPGNRFTKNFSRFFRSACRAEIIQFYHIQHHILLRPSLFYTTSIWIKV